MVNKMLLRPPSIGLAPPGSIKEIQPTALEGDPNTKKNKIQEVIKEQGDIEKAYVLTKIDHRCILNNKSSKNLYSPISEVVFISSCKDKVRLKLNDIKSGISSDLNYEVTVHGDGCEVFYIDRSVGYFYNSKYRDLIYTYSINDWPSPIKSAELNESAE